MEDVGPVLEYGDYPPPPLQTRRLGCLQVSPELRMVETPTSKESTFWHKKVAALLKDVIEVKFLSLRLPGLPCTPYGPLPRHLWL
jgi:hypothetical protein